MRRAARRLPTVSPPAEAARLRRARLAIIRADYNREITDSLERKCLSGLAEGGIQPNQVRCFAVPGCFEIPLLAAKLAASGRYDIIIALGSVIQGETYHFKLVAEECARGVMAVTLQYGVPIIFEVLATYNRRDALRRAGDNPRNKGIEAAQAAISMLGTLARLDTKFHR